MSNIKTLSSPIALTTFAHAPETARSVVDTFSTPIGKTGAVLAGFLELKRGPFLPESLLEIIKTTIKRAMSGQPKAEELEEHFEDALLEVNDLLKRHFSEEDQSDDHFLAAGIMLVGQHEVSFALGGAAKAFLLQREQGGKASEWTNLFNGTPTKPNKKTFGSLFSGTVSSGDTLLICTERFFDVTAGEKLKTALKKVVGGDLADHLAETLIDTDVPVAAIVAQGAPQQKRAAAMKKTETQASTVTIGAVLSGMGSGAQRVAATTGRIFSTLIDRLLPPAQTESSTEAEDETQEETEASSTENHEPSATPMRHARTPLIHTLFKRKKLALGLLAVVLIGGGIANAAHNRSVAEERARYNGALERIAALEHDAESALIYHDTARAQSAITEAQAVLEGLALTSNARSQRAAVIAQELKHFSDKFQYAVSAEPKTVYSFAASTADASFHPTTLALVSKEKKPSLLLGDGQLRKFAWLDPKESNPKLQAMTLDAATIGAVNDIIPSDQGALLIENNGALQELLTAGPGSIEARPIAEGPSEIMAAALYQKKLYVVDGAKARITKHLPTAGGFAKGSAWIKDIPELNTAASMVIDGTIFVATNDGKVLKFFQGKRQNFALTIDPPLSGKLTVMTNAESPLLFIAVPATNRIVVAQKEAKDGKPAGTLVAQYVVERWKDLKDFTVDEQTGVAYVLNGDALEKIELTGLPKPKTPTPPAKKPATPKPATPKPAASTSPKPKTPPSTAPKKP